MKFTKEQIAEKIQELGTKATPEEIRAGLVEFQKDLENDYEEHNQVVTENTSLKDKNKKLQEDNMTLFLAVGEKKKEEPEKKDTEKRKFEDLYNDKGELK